MPDPLCPECEEPLQIIITCPGLTYCGYCKECDHIYFLWPKRLTPERKAQEERFLRKTVLRSDVLLMADAPPPDVLREEDA